MSSADSARHWSERAEAYRESEAHREGEDLDLIVEWAAGARTALDVATGGGHVARRLRDAGLQVVSCDPAPGMRPDVVCRAEDLPFADDAFDVVATRVAAHHFEEVGAAVGEMARVAGRHVLVVDNLYLDDAAEEADRVRDPSHVRNYTEAEWRDLLEGAGLEVEDVRRFEKPIEVVPWLERAGCLGEEAARVRELLGDRMRDGWLTLDRIAIRAAKR
jgi:SAM-dependent methyltransferase